MELRPYQLQAVEELRQGVRQSLLRQILCIPTGGGKTVIAAHMIKAAADKGSRVAFLVDRVALVGQTSRTLYDYEIPHGIAQGANTRDRHEPIQVCSAQTIEKRGFWPGLDLLFVDECHTQRRKTLEFIQNVQIPVIGLTATPFSKGLGQTYQRVINVTTTDQLTHDGFLAPLQVYAAKEIDVSGLKTQGGEWRDSDLAERGSHITGDIVSTWAEKTKHHFGGPVKTLVFSATVAHGEELCEGFQRAGYDFRQISYKDRDDDHRAKLIRMFREGRIDGLVSCEALAKGFDVPDVKCLVCARPYRKSFASHIQMIGRAMRSAPGKEYALLLDHTGNYLGFYRQMVDFFANGAPDLDDGRLEDRVRDAEPKIKEELACSCGFILPPNSERCPVCGKESKRKAPGIETRAGELEMLTDLVKKEETPEWLRSRKDVWHQLCHFAYYYKRQDQEKAKKLALAQYRNLFGTWPPFPFEKAEYCDPRLERKVRSMLIRYAKRRVA